MSLLETGYGTLLPWPAAYNTSKPTFYSSKGKPGKHCVRIGKEQIRLSKECRNSSLMTKATEVVLGYHDFLPIDFNQRPNPWDSEHVSYPYLFDLSVNQVNEDDPDSLEYEKLNLYVVELEQKHLEVVEVPFLPAPPRHVHENMTVKESFNPTFLINPGESHFFQGFPVNCTLMEIGKDVFCIFGGKVGDLLVNELSVLQFNKDERTQRTSGLVYKPVLQGELPSPREKFSFCHSENAIFLFGGMIEGCLLNDMWKIELLGWDHWKESMLKPVVRVSQVITCESTSARADAGMAVCGRKIYIFGGKGNSGVDLPLSVLSMDTWIWTNAEYSGPRAVPGNEDNWTVATKDPIIVVYHPLDNRKARLWLLDTNLMRSSVILLKQGYLLSDCLGPFLFASGDGVFQFMAGTHYRCHNIPQVTPALHLIMGVLFDSGVYFDTELVFNAQQTIKLLKCCLVTRGIEAKGVLDLLQTADNVAQHFTYLVLRSALRYLYTDTITCPQLPFNSHKGSVIDSEQLFFEELRECATKLNMLNLKNLCVIALSQNCYIDNSKVSLYADYQKLVRVEPEGRLELSRCDSFATEYSHVLAPDYQLICSDGVVHVHKFLLFARSALFRQVFAGGFVLDREEFALDFPTRTVLIVKWFLYTDSVSIPPDALVSVMQLAASLVIPDLFLLCQRQAAYEINYSSFMATYQLALELNALHLVQYCEDVFYYNRLGNIQQYRDYLAENPFLRERLNRPDFSHFLKMTPENYAALPETDQVELLSAYSQMYPSPKLTSPSPFPKTEYFDILSDLSSHIQEIQFTGKLNVCTSPFESPRLSRHTSLEDERWELGNRFILSDSDDDST